MSFTRTLRAVGSAVAAGALLFSAAPTALADQNRDDQWPLKAFDAQSVWKESTGKGVTVAVIDDSVNGSHPDLKGNVLPGKNFVDGGRGDQKGTRDHGTGMASLIAGHGHGAGNSDGVMGLAPDAKILPVAVPGGGDDASGSSVGSWVRYAVDQGASVINISLNPYYVGEADKSALAYALEKDALVVVGAGNDGQSKISELASVPGVVSVGAVDKAGKVWSKSNSGSQLMLSAPGVEITSASATPGLYRVADGTSDSTAYVSAAAALLRSKFPNLSAGQIANRLVKSAGLPPGKEGLKLPDPHYGYGFIQPLKALTADIPAGPKNGPLKAPEAGPASNGGVPSAPGAGDDQASGQKDSGLGTGAIVGIAAGVLVVVAAVVVLVVVRQKKNGRNGPPPGGPGGGFGGPGFPQQPSPYQQQPGPYQQQPGVPGAFPPAPPTQPPGQ
ncbi:putative M8 family peptidase [Streptomyces sp. NBRC 110611]|uniref:S8 family serine peptidase n=1 Tax=Streptomyces sp. NBRC 110611 TaxID=1621259 RepID=UPI0008578C3E|nr:S8 family serine peptidase [Streptomyces sp. NBRC 110611]GAU70035.1 putative M8 family peptidase [Streptomyces sp. NBRC 110611]